MQQPDDDPLCLVFIPALVVILHRMETDKGAPLNQDEVEAIRDKSVCMKMPYSKAIAMEEKRGYQDVRPEHAWADWQEVRKQLQDR